ncbi:MAG: pyruvate carboxyltransferase [Desulfovibrio sp.]|nr:MAG: pyruvate carboxyltransferase [Desulfovibrio sp.]
MLIDTTLREGAQLFGVYMNGEDRIRIMRGLEQLGVQEMELGWIGQEGIQEQLDSARSLNPRAHLSVWSPCRMQDIRTAAEMGVTRLNLGMPVSDAHLSERLGLGREQALELVELSVGLALQLGIEEVSLGLEDVSRADTSFALRMAELAVRTGAWRIRLADTVGVFTPLDMADLVRVFRDKVKCFLAVHCHNDFGMATANSCTGLEAGADYADVSLLGMGERAGIAATEEVAAWLAVQAGADSYDLEGLRPLCEQAAELADLPLSRIKAVAGKDIFACETGLHVHGIHRNTDLFEPFSPELVGAERRVGLGAKSGRAAVRSALLEDIPDDRPWAEAVITALTKAVRRCSLELGRPLSHGEFHDLAAVCKGSSC